MWAVPQAECMPIEPGFVPDIVSPNNNRGRLMKLHHAVSKSLKATLIGSLLTLAFFTQASHAGEGLNLDYAKSLKVVEYTKSLKVTGFKLAEGVYMGHAKVGGKYGLGVVVKRKTFSWGINNRGISIMKRF